MTNGHRRGPSSQVPPGVPKTPPRRGRPQVIGPKRQPSKRPPPTHIPNSGAFLVHDCIPARCCAKRCAGVQPTHLNVATPRGLPHSQGCRVEIPILIRGTTSHLDARISGHLTSEQLPALIESRQGSTLIFDPRSLLALSKTLVLPMDHAAAAKFVRPHR